MVSSSECIQPAGYVTENGDCDDDDADRSPEEQRSVMRSTTTVMEPLMKISLLVRMQLVRV